jgi:hypothetical protein
MYIFEYLFNSFIDINSQKLNFCAKVYAYLKFVDSLFIAKLPSRKAEPILLCLQCPLLPTLAKLALFQEQ